MQMDFVAKLNCFEGGYEWYDSDDYSMHFIGTPGKNRPKTPEAQRRVRCSGPVEEIENEKFRQYDPFQSAPTMFLEFAELEYTEEAVLGFTNRYGKLWDHFSGPSLADYCEAIEDLYDAVWLWRGIQQRDEDLLKVYVAWDSAGRLKWKSDFAKPIRHGDEIIHFIDVKQGPRNYKRGDLLGPATDLLDFVINTRPTWVMGIKPVRRDELVSLELEVDGMLAVLWVQFAVTVAEGKTYARCQHCNRPFELAPQVNRADRLFCSDNCRVKAYQRRKKQVFAMRKQGDALRDIVKATGSDMESVKKWIAEYEAQENSDGQKTKRKR